MQIQAARELGQKLALFVEAGQTEAAYAQLAPVLAERTPFRLLDVIGGAVGERQAGSITPLLERIAAGRTEGGWVVIAAALSKRILRDLPGALEFAKKTIVTADIWYATDILGERVPGPAFVACFEPALALLGPWREAPNRWVRRTTGVAVHFWAKRARGDPRQLPQAQALLDFLEPMFTEKEPDAVKGAGWGLKTLGRYYPELATEWLVRQAHRPHRALMLRKALTFLSPEQRARVLGEHQ
jgi:hypothetical protein